MAYTIKDAEAAGWEFQRLDNMATAEMSFRRRQIAYRIWLSTLSGRWYWHRRASGNITDDGSYATRGSARRAVLQRIAKEG